VSSIAALGNVYVQIIEREQVKQLVYPGVFQQDIYIPVRKDDPNTIDMIRKDAVVKVFQPELLDSVLTWKQRSSGKVIQEEITLVKVQAPVAFILDIIRGIKPFFYTDKMWRVIVVLHADHSNSYGLKSFFGTTHDNYAYYSLLLK
jgi:hypothetical protein